MTHAIADFQQTSDELEERVLRQVEREVGDRVPAWRLAAVTREVLPGFADARIRQFVPILATRAVLAALRIDGLI